MNKTITQEEIEKAALDYIRTNPFVNFRTATTARESFVDGANFTLDKQESKQETVISGWVAIDEAYDQCFLHTEKPIQKAQPIADTGDYDTVWDSKGKTYLLDTGLFPDMDSDSDPIEVELIIKRKKKNL